MKRDLYGMTAKAYDLVIVGGGITGACIARDAALRGLSVALVEKHDFANATSAASSKLIHGGLRYLENLEIGLVRESLRERRMWSNIAPHLVDPLTFLMPTSGKGVTGRLKYALGLTAYDWLAYDRNRRLDDPDKAIPSHGSMGRDEALGLEPNLESSAFTGAMTYYDYQMYSPERLALECVHSAVEHGADIANYARVTEFLKEGDRILGVRVEDVATGGEEFTVRGKMTINAAGPWADLLMKDFIGDRRGKQLIRSKGIHLLTRPLTSTHGVAFHSGEGHIFILPWRGHSLIGTTDTLYRGHPDDFCVTEEDIAAFLDVINGGFAGAELTRADVLHFYGGLRPIVDPTSSASGEDEDEADSYSASRAAEIYDHEEKHELKGVLTVIGGKWTTSRNLAEQVVDLASKKLGGEDVPCTTDLSPSWGGEVGPFADYMGRALVRLSALPAPVIENLARNYGGHMDDVLELGDGKPELLEPVCDRYPDVGAQVLFAVRNEMAVRLEDVLFRRTGLGTIGTPGEEAIGRVADIMAEELGWDEAERSLQIDLAMAKFQTHPEPVAKLEDDS